MMRRAEEKTQVQNDPPQQQQQQQQQHEVPRERWRMTDLVQQGLGRRRRAWGPEERPGLRG